jgi:hypothetical protein
MVAAKVGVEARRERHRQRVLETLSPGLRAPAAGQRRARDLGRRYGGGPGVGGGPLPYATACNSCSIAGRYCTPAAWRQQ